MIFKTEMIVRGKGIVDLFTVEKKKRKNLKDQVGIFFIKFLYSEKAGKFSKKITHFWFYIELNFSLTD